MDFKDSHYIRESFFILESFIPSSSFTLKIILKKVDFSFGFTPLHNNGWPTVIIFKRIWYKKKTSQRGVNFIKQFEDLRLTAYYDSASVLTIGYGHTKRSATADKYPVYVGQTITAPKAEEIL